jgi:large conductance mechanosensitive channel
MSERTASPLRLQRPEWVNEFRDFIMRGNVVDLAIGVIIGSAFTGIVQGLVKERSAGAFATHSPGSVALR